MDWSHYLNPFTYLGNAAGKIVADGWTAAMLGIWNAGLWLLKLVLGLEDKFLVPDLSPDGPMRSIYPYTFWMGGALVLILAMIQLAAAAFRRDGASIARVLIGSAQFVIVWVTWVVYAVAVLAAAGGLTRALMQALLGVRAMNAWQPWTGFSTSDIVDGTLATVLGVMGFLLIFSAFGHLLIMLARGASLLVLAATNPIAAAGLVWEGGRSWFWKAFRWFHAAAFTPVIMMLMLGLGVQITSEVATSTASSLEQAIGSAVPGVMLILVGCFAPLALFKMLAFVDPGTSSGAAMRTGLAAQGGLPGLIGGGGQGTTSDAASTSEAGGQSQGEATTEAATNERFAKSASGLGAVFGQAGQAVAAAGGMAASAGARAATLGADLTNQMGVGHNTYVPDFAGSRTRGRNNSGPANQDQDVPDINGGGTDPFDPAPGALPSTSPPPVPTADGPPGAGGPSTGAAGNAAAGGGEAAAAIPIVPV